MCDSIKNKLMNVSNCDLSQKKCFRIDWKWNQFKINRKRKEKVITSYTLKIQFTKNSEKFGENEKEFK
jgi:hypothetical protein